MLDVIGEPVQDLPSADLLRIARECAVAFIEQVEKAKAAGLPLPQTMEFDGSCLNDHESKVVIENIISFIESNGNKNGLKPINTVESSSNIISIDAWRMHPERKHKELIPPGKLQSATREELLDALLEKEGVPEGARSQIREGFASMLANAASGHSWRDRVRSDTPATADVRLPEVPPELWKGSAEQQKAAAGEMPLDEAVPAFTARVYSGLLPGQQPVGIAITDFKDGDRPLYDEWVSLKKRINSRKDNTWPGEYPFSSRKARNDFVFDQLEAGKLLPPSDPRTYASMKSSFSKSYDTNLDGYLPGPASIAP